MKRRLRNLEEPPDWLLFYDQAQWDEPDDEERQLVDGLPPDLAREVHPWHCSRRWASACDAWYREHPRSAREWVSDLFWAFDHPQPVEGQPAPERPRPAVQAPENGHQKPE
jgi:hypothetical protein